MIASPSPDDYLVVPTGALPAAGQPERLQLQVVLPVRYVESFGGDGVLGFPLMVDVALWYAARENDKGKLAIKLRDLAAEWHPFLELDRYGAEVARTDIEGLEKLSEQLQLPLPRLLVGLSRWVGGMPSGWSLRKGEIPGGKCPREKVVRSPWEGCGHGSSGCKAR